MTKQTYDIMTMCFSLAIGFFLFLALWITR